MSVGRYSEVCGASNRDGEPCGLPAGWGTGDSSGRCKFHGGMSSGPSDTSHLENNDFAEGNPGGGAPELNTNAQTANGVWCGWRKVYERLPGERRDYVDRVTADLVDKVEPYTPDMDAERRERLVLEFVVLGRVKDRIGFDVWCGFGEDAASDARGFTVEREVEVDGETYTVEKPNPSLTRDGSVTSRRQTIKEELNLVDAWQGKEPPNSEDGDNRSLAEALSADE